MLSGLNYKNLVYPIVFMNVGTLQHLQALEQQAHELSHGGESRVKQERMLRALQKAVHQLQEKRDLLKVQIANSPNKVG